MPKRTLQDRCQDKYETAWRTALTMADNDQTVAVGIFQAITKAESLDKIAHTIQYDVAPPLEKLRGFAEDFFVERVRRPNGSTT